MKINPFTSVQQQMLAAIDISNLKEGYKKQIPKILVPEKVHIISIPVQMDNGEIKIFTGFRSQYNSARGPYKGGIRFHSGVDIYEVQALSAWMSIKCSVVNIPLGGGKGGVIVNPKDLSKNELEQLSRNYVAKLYENIGPQRDIPAPDINTNGEIMAWMMDEYSRLKGEYSPGSFTGKPLEVGGSKGRETATSWGGVYTLLKILESKDEDIKGKKIIIEGAGKVGLNFAKIIESKGASIIGISDSKGAIFNKTGINISQIEQLKGKSKSVTEYSDATQINNDEFFAKKCDILVPAALENTITEENVKSIDTNMILELANGPITPGADKILYERNIMVVPDILANAGGVIVSYFEQVQNNTNLYWEEEEINKKLEKKICQSTEEVLKMTKKTIYQFKNRSL